ncbi:MAG: hypothetical protein H6747_06980 [Deltaproteobacteria bacterium]|nr:hypothetical protein [Deltaproteobacteria bacterium]
MSRRILVVEHVLERRLGSLLQERSGVVERARLEAAKHRHLREQVEHRGRSATWSPARTIDAAGQVAEAGQREPSPAGDALCRAAFCIECVIPSTPERLEHRVLVAEDGTLKSVRQGGLAGTARSIGDDDASLVLQCRGVQRDTTAKDQSGDQDRKGGALHDIAVGVPAAAKGLDGELTMGAMPPSDEPWAGEAPAIIAVLEADVRRCVCITEIEHVEPQSWFGSL